MKTKVSSNPSDQTSERAQNLPEQNIILENDHLQKQDKTLKGLLFAFGAIIFFVLGAGGMWLYQQKSITQPAVKLPVVETKNEKPEPTQEPVSVPADWKTYENKVFNFNFKFPKDFTITDKIPLNETKIVGPYDSLKLTDNLKEIELTLWVNPSGFGPFFPNKEIFVDYSKTKGVVITDEKMVDLSQYPEIANSDKIQIAVRDFTSPQNHHFYLYFTYNKNNTDAESLLKQILSTFKFTDNLESADTSNWMMYTDSQYGFSFQYPEDTTLSKTNAYSMLSSEPSDSIQVEYPHQSQNEPGYIFNVVIRENLVNSDAKKIIDEYVNEIQKTCTPPACSLPDKVNSSIKEYSNGEIKGYQFHIGAETDSVMVVSVNDKKTYIFRISDGNGYANEQGLPIFEKILSTFKYKN